MASRRPVTKYTADAGNPVTIANEPAPVADQTQDDLLARLKRMFSDYQSLTNTARSESAMDVDYYDSKQWSAQELTALARRGQPDLVINRIKPAINGILGVVERGKSDPRAWPRNPTDEDTADVATDVLRYIADYNRFTKVKVDCFTDMLIPGTMALLVGADEDLQVTFEQVRWEEFFADPRSRRKDFKDARYLGIAKWMYADEVAARWPGKSIEVEGTSGGVAGMPDLTFLDRPNMANIQWVDRKQRRIMVIELYYQEDGWRRCVFHVSGILEEGPSPYVDHKGKPHCPIEAQSAYVDRDNNRYGAVRDMRGPQDEINKRRSKLLHLLSVSQIEVADPSAIDVDADVARREAARPDGVIPYGWRKVSTNDMAAGQAQLLAEAKSEIERMGPNPAVLGRDGNDSSGRALLARQQAGLVELANLFAQQEDWELRVYRQAWARAKQFWKAPQWIRVTDSDDAPKFVGINQPIHEMAPVTDPQTGQPMADDHGQPKQAPVMYAHPQEDGTHRIGPRVLGYKNELGEMDVDINIETVQDTGTLAQEQFQDLLQIVGANPTWASQVPVDVMIRLSSIPHKREVLDMMQEHREAAQQSENGKDQMAAALAKSQIELREAQAALAQAKAGQATANAITDHQVAHADAAHDGLTTGLASIPGITTPPPGDPSQGQGATAA